MEGSMFYWVFWLFWVYFTFIVNKQNIYRLKLSAAILIVIIFTNYYYTFAGFAINMGGLWLLLFSYVSLYNEKTNRILYFLICSFIVTIAYVTFHLFEIYDPVWIIFNKDWMMGICLGYLVILLQKNLKGRLFIITSGMMQGEILYAYILSKYDFQYPIGSLACLDAFSLTSLLLTGWNFIEHTGSLFDGYFHSGQKNKQKTS